MFSELELLNFKAVKDLNIDKAQFYIIQLQEEIRTLNRALEACFYTNELLEHEVRNENTY